MRSISKNKRAAMEMTMGTIVTIVLLVAVLILGIVFIRRAMCSGIVITDQISTAVENQVKSLFGSNEYGVHCMGEGSDQVKLGDGGRRQFYCVINSKEQKNYEIKVTSVKSLRAGGATDAQVQGWIIDKAGFSGTVSPGETTKTILVFDIPDQTPDTALRVDVSVTDKTTNRQDTITSYVDVTPVGTVAAAIC